MAQALLGGLLPAVFSGADQLKRGVYGLLTNPQEQAERAAQSLLQSRAERQALMARTFANPNRPFQVTDQAGLAQLGNDVLMGELGIAPVGMIAYHGTPHLIKDKFDISKVGTGEGAQSYGHGMYFAENPAVAKQYQAALSDTKYFADGKQLKGNDAWAAQFLHDFQDDALPKKVDVNTAVAKANEILKAGEAREEIVNKIKLLDKTGVSVESGNLYKVDIPDEYVPKMLDWDKPLSQQPKSVQDALAKIDPDSYSPKGMDYDPSELGQTIYHRLAQKSDEPLRQEWVKKRDMLLEKGLKNNPELEAHLMTNPNPYQVGSQLLNEYGIKGIRYLDAGSREVGGTSNFVVFDPTDVKILERNNQPFEGLLGN